MVFAIEEIQKRGDKPRKQNVMRRFVGLFSNQYRVKQLLKTDPEPKCTHYMVYYCVVDQHDSDPTSWHVTKEGEWL